MKKHQLASFVILNRDILFEDYSPKKLFHFWSFIRHENREDEQKETYPAFSVSDPTWTESDATESHQSENKELNLVTMMIQSRTDSCFMHF